MLQAYKRRMGWTFPWASSSQEFQRRLQRLVHEENSVQGGIEYNYQVRRPAWPAPRATEGPVA